jgi:hypothetical protein
VTDTNDVGSAAGNALLMLSKAIIAEGDAKFWLRLMDQVIRDGRKLYGGAIEKAHFDAVFAGNLGEFFKLIYQVLDHNFGDSIRAELGNLSGLLDGAPGELGRNLREALTGGSPKEAGEAPRN